MKRFKLSSCGDDFTTGVARDGRQVLMGLLCPHLVVVLFDDQGVYLTTEVHPLSQEPPRRENDGPYQIYDEAFRESLMSDIQQQQSTLGIREQTIEVQRFRVEDHCIGLDVLPTHLAQFKADPAGTAEDDEDFREMQEELRDWEISGNCVLWWAKDYWVGPDGEVVST